MGREDLSEQSRPTKARGCVRLVTRARRGSLPVHASVLFSKRALERGPQVAGLGSRAPGRKNVAVIHPPGNRPLTRGVENGRTWSFLALCPDLKVNWVSSLPLSATPKSSPGPDHLCRDDPLPDVRGHQREAGADGGPHELSAMP